ncbi:MAG: site-specific integrase [Bacteroidetes bacterium]|nr:site-specific integrase [Bacteroidota bacterium]
MVNVIKRERKLKNSTALYLDYRVNGKRFQEATNLHLLPPKDERARQLNKENLIRFEKLRIERQNQLLNGIVPLPIDKKKFDFFQYYKEFFQKFPTKERRADAVLKKLQLFHQKSSLPIAMIDEGYLVRFKNYLEEKLSGETPHNYFKLLCKVIRYATKEGLFNINPAQDIRITRKAGVAKNIVTMDEIRVLVEADCSNSAVKNAFLFSCFTGLRYCDVSRLKWGNITNGKVSLVQAKTGYVVDIELHINATRFLTDKKDDNSLVFDLPSTLNGCNKVLKAWVYKAGIEKKITWHCGRHSFATNLILHGADIISTSSLMGQRSIKYTQRYVKIADSMKKQAVQLLPNI